MAVPVLVECLNDKDSSVRIAAAEALFKIGGPETKEAMSALTNLLKSKNYSDRVGAAVALGRIGPAAKAAIPALNELLRDEVKLVHTTAAEALEKIEANKK